MGQLQGWRELNPFRILRESPMYIPAGSSVVNATCGAQTVVLLYPSDWDRLQSLQMRVVHHAPAVQCLLHDAALKRELQPLWEMISLKSAAVFQSYQGHHPVYSRWGKSLLETVQSLSAALPYHRQDWTVAILDHASFLAVLQSWCWRNSVVCQLLWILSCIVVFFH